MMRRLGDLEREKEELSAELGATRLRVADLEDVNREQQEALNSGAEKVRLLGVDLENERAERIKAAQARDAEVRALRNKMARLTSANKHLKNDIEAGKEYYEELMREERKRAAREQQELEQRLQREQASGGGGGEVVKLMKEMMADLAKQNEARENRIIRDAEENMKRLGKIYDNQKRQSAEERKRHETEIRRLREQTERMQRESEERETKARREFEGQLMLLRQESSKAVETQKNAAVVHRETIERLSNEFKRREDEAKKRMDELAEKIEKANESSCTIL